MLTRSNTTWVRKSHRICTKWLSSYFISIICKKKKIKSSYPINYTKMLFSLQFLITYWQPWKYEKIELEILIWKWKILFFTTPHLINHVSYNTQNPFFRSGGGEGGYNQSDVRYLKLEPAATRSKIISPIQKFPWAGRIINGYIIFTVISPTINLPNHFAKKPSP